MVSASPIALCYTLILKMCQGTSVADKSPSTFLYWGCAAFVGAAATWAAATNWPATTPLAQRPFGPARPHGIRPAQQPRRRDQRSEMGSVVLPRRLFLRRRPAQLERRARVGPSAAAAGAQRLPRRHDYRDQERRGRGFQRQHRAPVRDQDRANRVDSRGNELAGVPIERRWRRRAPASPTRTRFSDCRLRCCPTLPNKRLLRPLGKTARSLGFATRWWSTSSPKTRPASVANDLPRQVRIPSLRAL